MGNIFNLKNFSRKVSKDGLFEDNKKNNKSELEAYKEYLNLISSKLHRNYNENKNNQINLCLSLNKKDFNTISTSKRISTTKTEKFIYWKDFLLNYLLKQSNKGYTWAENLSM